ncbi:hypothetical protein LJC68_04435 [Bacteroidales bacterium OttesenSCG-928-B11]|nr:hypothetical protein [Bacteroidales bacterium OttesenSCG-928-C03]MDL2312106.1 hypothetical protein [Bacteroidales bacterium OttesenSCG-928-B11]MDL2326079.1 hypothetical protein [Bacteroidales bacterium OttesenSCG-928-A14]
MEKYRNRYRIQSHRMPNWDYSGNGVYFITLVTQHRECNLGRILAGNNEKMDGTNDLHGSHGSHVEAHGHLHVETHGRASLQLWCSIPIHLICKC